MNEAPAKKKSALPIVVAGFGLIGLLCVGGGLVVGIPAFSKYIARSKAAEARTNVRALLMGAESYCRANDGAYPTAPAGPLPASPGSQPQVASFAGEPTFVALGFTPVDPLYYSYSVERDGEWVLVIRAHGDLDDDGIRSTFEGRCQEDCLCDSHPSFVNELE